MLDVTEPSTSPSRITSSTSPLLDYSPSPSPDSSPSHLPKPSTQHSPDNTTAAASQPSPTQPSPTQPSPTHLSPRAEHHFPSPHESPLHDVHSHGSDEGSLKLNELMNLVTKLSNRIRVLKDDLKKTKKTYSSAYTKLILRGRKLSNAEVQDKESTETELFIQEVTPTEVIQDQEGSEKGSDEVSTAGAKKGTASEKVLIVSTTEGKAIMIESEPKKKSKKEIEQERLSFAEAIRLEEQMNKEQIAQIARGEEIARQWDEEER
ncbi:hypothetical protein Tco_1233482 [Tanacetum coccineum]